MAVAAVAAAVAGRKEMALSVVMVEMLRQEQ